MLARSVQSRLAEHARFASISDRMWSAAFSPDSRQIVTTDDKGARVWDAQTSQLLHTLPHGDTVYQAAYSSDGKHIVTAGGDDAVRIWDAANGALVRELTRKQKRRYCAIAMPSDGKFVAAIDVTGGVVHVWAADSGAPLAEIRNDALDYPGLALSADGRWLATSGGGDVSVFDAQTWTPAHTIPGPRTYSLSFDPTGPYLVTGTAGGDASIWAIPSGERIRHLREVGEPVDAVAFSPDGSLVVVASRDGRPRARRDPRRSRADHRTGVGNAIQHHVPCARHQRRCTVSCEAPNAVNSVRPLIAEFAKAVDDIRYLIAKADAFAHGAESVFEGGVIQVEDPEDRRRLERLDYLIDAAASASQAALAATEQVVRELSAGDKLAREFSARGQGA